MPVNLKEATSKALTSQRKFFTCSTYFSRHFRNKVLELINSCNKCSFSRVKKKNGLSSIQNCIDFQTTFEISYINCYCFGHPESAMLCVSTSAATSATNVLPGGCMSLLRDPNITSGDRKYNRSHAVGAFSSCTGSRETLKETDLDFSLLVLPFRSTCRFRIIRITSHTLCSGTPCRSKFVSLLHLS